MASTTRYTVHVGGKATDFTRSTKATAVAEAEAQAKATRKAVEVQTGTGAVVFSLPAAKQRVAYRHKHPDTKVIEVDAALAALIPAGYVPAYRRPTKGTTVLRNEAVADEEREDDSKFAVMLDDGSIPFYGPTTRAVGRFMTARAKAKASAA